MAELKPPESVPPRETTPEPIQEDLGPDTYIRPLHAKDIRKSINQAVSYAALADMQAVANMTSLIGRICSSSDSGGVLPEVRIHTADDLSDVERCVRRYRGGIIFSVGLFSNALSASIMELIPSVILEQYEEGKVCWQAVVTLRRKFQGMVSPKAGYRRYRAKDNSEFGSTDIAVLVKLFVEDTTFLVIGGMGEVGTERAAAFLASNSVRFLEAIRRRLSLRQQDSFAVVFRIPIDGGTEPEVVFEQRIRSNE